LFRDRFRLLPSFPLFFFFPKSLSLSFRGFFRSDALSFGLFFSGAALFFLLLFAELLLNEFSTSRDLKASTIITSDL
jgi:hypothetical protein